MSGVHHAGRVVEHGEAGRSETGSDLAHRIEVHRHVQLRRSEDGVRGTGEERLELPSLGWTTGELFHEVPEGRPEREFEYALAPDVTADREEHRSGRGVGAVRPEPAGTLGEDVRDVGKRLDVVHERRVVV